MTSGQAPDEFDRTLEGDRPPLDSSMSAPDHGETAPGERPVIDGRYRVIRAIGHGGMGDVYLAEDKDMGEMVAVKVLPSIIGSRKREVERLRQEAKLCRNLNHQNIVSTYTFGLDESRGNNPYLVMQYIDGVTLDDELADFPNGVPLDRAGRWIREIASALDYAHESAILHRDIKPSNIMIDKTERAYLMDFGIARQAHDTMLEVTGRDSSGTPKYMSPQQLAGKNSKANDIYSFAATVYEMLGGSAPFSSGDITYQIREVPPSPIEQLPDHVNAALLSGLAKAASQRPGTAMAFAESILTPPSERSAPVAAAPSQASPSVDPMTPPRLRIRTRSRTTKTGSRTSGTSGTSGTGTSTGMTAPGVEAPGVDAGRALLASIGGGAAWALLAGLGTWGLLSAGSALPDLVGPAGGSVAMGLGAGLVLGAIGGAAGHFIPTRMIGVIVLAVLSVASAAAVAGAAASGVGIGACAAVLLASAMLCAGVWAASFEDVWLRSGPAIATGVALASCAAIAGIVGGAAPAAPALTVLLFSSAGALFAAGGTTLFGGLGRGLVAGVFGAAVGVGAAACLTGAASDVTALAIGAGVCFALAPLGAVFVGFLGRFWNPLGA